MPPNHEFYFLRHGETEGNRDLRLQGQTNTGLTERGRLQAHWLAERWAQAGVRFDQIIASPLVRARQTAEIINTILAAPLELDIIWSERSFGILEGETFADIQQRQPPVDYYNPYAGFEGSGETQTDLFIRALSGVQGLVQRAPGCYLIVTHGALLGRICYAIMGLNPSGHQTSPIFRIENTGYLHAVYESTLRRWVIISITNPNELKVSLPEEK